MANLITSDLQKKFLEKAPELENYMNNTELELEPNFQPPFQYLTRAIIYQQLSGKAASTIHGRFLDLVGDVTPSNLLEFDVEQLRSVGLSRQKASYIHNVANAFQNHLAEYLTADDLTALENEKLIELLTQIKGVGQWTVEMYLIFGLGRLDVFSAGDLGVRRGVGIMYDTAKLPTPGQAKKLTKHWGELATIGTILSWRIQD